MLPRQAAYLNNCNQARPDKISLRGSASEMDLMSTPAALRAAPFLPFIAGALAVAIFVADMVTPPDVAISSLYAVVVLLAANYFQRRGVLLVSLACLSLTVLSLSASHGVTADSALASALVSLLVIGATTFLALQNQSANAALREQAQLLDLTHDTIFVRDSNDLITYWNRGAEQLYGWRRDEAIGKTTHRLLETVFPLPLQKIRAELLRTGRWEGELVHTKRDGTHVTVSSRWSLQRVERGLPAAVMETNNDINGRKQAEYLTGQVFDN